jgi:2'-5' RNA ligase
LSQAATALIVALPEAEPHVAALRMAHDPSAAQGVPAHVTLLHPFRPLAAVDAALRAAIVAVAARSAPFDVRFVRPGRFEQTLYLAPDPPGPFVALVRALAAAFPEHPPYGGRHADVRPHLTVAQGAAATLDAAAAALARALPRGGIAARVRTLELIANEHGRWRRVHAWTLGTGAAE